MNRKEDSIQVSNIVLIAIFLIVQLLFLNNMFSFAFIILLLTIVAAVLFSEKQRLFIWTFFCFFVGLFAFIYGDRLLLLFFSNENALIISRLVLLFPIIIMSYVIYKFKKPIIKFTILPNWKREIKFPFVWWGFKKTTISIYFIFLIILIILIPLFSEFTFSQMNLERIVKISLFSILNGILVEFIWRGILLTQINELIGEKLAAVVTSLSCAFFYHFIGLPLFETGLIFLLGIFFGGLTLKSNSMILPIILHIIYTFTLIFQGYFPL